uniref:(S)-2-hydroxy-acid oxidase n=1 Tax=Amblyomma parvum TaxID=251391 RepID=A0A023FZS9_AMBPA
MATILLPVVVFATAVQLSATGQVPQAPLAPKRSACKDVVTVDDLRLLGVRKMERSVRDYYESGADQEQTLHENVAAFKRLRLRYRVLNTATYRNLETTLLGHRVAMPVGIAPSAMQRMAHPDGETGTARASQLFETAMILSTLSSTSLEEVRRVAPKALLWLQLYVFKNRSVTTELIHRAERAGYKALVLTVDTPTWGQRIVDIRNAFTIPKGITIANFHDTRYDHFDPTKGSGLTKYTNDFFDQRLTWDDVTWLKKLTHLPIVLKGIITAEDAKIAVQRGANAIIVSNHGGRQLDGSPSTIEALPEIVEAVKGLPIEVYLDSGVRTGTDVIKALALGARAVFVGRPALWGLAYNGEKGVTKMLEIFREETDRALALMGRRSVKDLKRTDVVRQEYYGMLFLKNRFGCLTSVQKEA